MDGYALSYPLNKALAKNSENVVYSDPKLRETEPTEDTYVGGLGSNRAVAQLLVLPYGDGPVGAKFKVRLYGWWHTGQTADPAVLWIPLIVAEFRVTLGTQNGLTGRFIGPNERFASEIELLSGSLGLYGSITNGPIASALVHMKGCRKHSFDFAQDQSAPAAFGNLLWSPASAF